MRNIKPLFFGSRPIRKVRTIRMCFAVVMVAISSMAHAATWYVATNGNDANEGSKDKPFATLQRANDAVEPGDTVYIRGGTYKMPSKQIARFEGVFARVVCLDKSGLPDRRIHYRAFEDEKPVFDFSDVKPRDYRVYAISIPASWIHIKGIEVVGVQVTIKEHTQSICFENNGSHNIYEQLTMHDNQAIGFYSVRGADNLVLNCDAYRNWDDTSENKLGGNSDGFGFHPRKGDTGNIFRGCRAWFNSDDGFDLINSGEPVLIDNCWSFYNGYSSRFKSLADGNGFKAGGYGSTPVSRLPDPIPRHIVRNCLAVRNKASGFYANHHIGGGDWIQNTACRNTANFNMLCRLQDNATDVPGYGHLLTGNLSYDSRSLITNIELDKCTLENNSFDLEREPKRSDFKSLDEDQLLLPRKANGDLPDISLLCPKEDSRFSGMGRNQQ